MEMMDESLYVSNYYTRALYYYKIGLLDKALSYFMKTISISYDYPEALNTAGLLLMYKGRFNDAVRLFYINVEHNGDDYSRKFIRELININTSIDRYNTAVDMINQNRYKEAAEILENERKQGFCMQNADILLCLVYFMLRRRSKCSALLEEIHAMDKGCVFYYEMRESIKKKKPANMLPVYGLAAILAVTNIYTGFRLMKQPERTVEKESVKYVDEQSTQSRQPDSAAQTDQNTSQLLTVLQGDIETGNYYDYAKQKDKLPYNTLNADQKRVMNSLNAAFTQNAAGYFYNNGMAYFRKKQYAKSSEYFKYAYQNKDGSYLDQHILYFLGDSLQLMNDDDFVNYYKEYLSIYKDDDYTPDVTYALAMYYYQEGSISDAKKYAEAIALNFKDSIYYNGKIKEVLGK